MHDHVNDYRTQARHRLAWEPSEPFSRSAQVLLLPSFHPEVLLRVGEGPTGTTLCLSTFTSSLWLSLYSPTRVRPERRVEAVQVPPERAARFWSALEEVKPQLLRDVPRVGYDGMILNASYQRGDSTSFAAWSAAPAPQSVIGRFVRVIYDLAWDVVKEPVGIERLEQLHAYLGIGLPARVIEGRVKCLRIFGVLALREQKALRALFSSLPAEEPIVVDLTNLDRMGTLLYPDFVAFASGRPLLAWAVSRHARRQLEAMDLDQPQIFDRTEDAVASVLQRAGADVPS
jgi:hypothetical protein